MTKQNLNFTWPIQPYYMSQTLHLIKKIAFLQNYHKPPKAKSRLPR